ncbi:MAG: inositol monophosphatase [Polyangiaceae bacterium]|nr:inositol monophosphatase [Polyangiaceae bacterium]
MLSTDPDLMEVMTRAGLRAADALRDAANRLERLEVHEKGAADFVSSADLRSEEILREDLSRAFPDHGFMMEESAHAERGSARARFIVDPLDGTTNFIRGVPTFAVSIARELDGVVTHGVVIDVARREIFSAVRGGGAFVDGKRMTTSRELEPSRMVVGTGIPHHGRSGHAEYLEALGNVMREVAGIRRMGAAALDLAYVAAGRFDAFFETGLAPWDVAAGMLLVQEAGGVVTRTDGGETRLSGDVLASSSQGTHDAMLGRLAPLHRRPLFSK